MSAVGHLDGAQAILGGQLLEHGCRVGVRALTLEVVFHRPGLAARVDSEGDVGVEVVAVDAGIALARGHSHVLQRVVDAVVVGGAGRGHHGRVEGNLVLCLLAGNHVAYAQVHVHGLHHVVAAGFVADIDTHQRGIFLKEDAQRAVGLLGERAVLRRFLASGLGAIGVADDERRRPLRRAGARIGLRAVDDQARAGAACAAHTLLQRGGYRVQIVLVAALGGVGDHLAVGSHLQVHAAGAQVLNSKTAAGIGERGKIAVLLVAGTATACRHQEGVVARLEQVGLVVAAGDVQAAVALHASATGRDARPGVLGRVIAQEEVALHHCPISFGIAPEAGQHLALEATPANEQHVARSDAATVGFI